MKALHIVLISLVGVLALAGLGQWTFRRHAAPATAHAHLKYQCPMHPQIVQDEPGECPICHMRLQLVPEGDGSGPAATPDSGTAQAQVGERKILKWRNPMNPAVFSDHFMKDSMGMDYLPVYADEVEQGSHSDVPDHAAFTLDEGRRQLIGVRSEAAEIGDIVRTLRLPGRVAETRGAIQAQALEMDGGLLKAGLSAEVWVTGEAARRARVASVDRSLDAYSRTFGVRLALLDAPGEGYRPGVYCDVRVALKLGHGVAVPKEAVLDTGDHQWVFVEKEGGGFEPRSVQTGPEGDEQVEILRGVAVGENVVTSANFLIDSESQFRAAAENFGAGK